MAGLRLQNILYGSYAAGVIGYVGYGLVTQRGLVGWMLDLELRAFGSAAMKLTALIAFVLLLLPAFLLRFGVTDRLPSRSGRQAPAPASLAATAGAPASAKQLMTMTAAFVLIPWLFAVPWYLWRNHAHQSEHGMELQAIWLLNGQDAPLPDNRFVTVHGVALADLALGLSHGYDSRDADWYVPITGPDGNPGQPWRYLVLLHGNEPLPSDYRLKPPFSGRAAPDSLPTHVLNEYRRKGYTVLEPNYLIEPVPLANGRVGDQSQEDWFIPIVAGVVSVFGGIAMFATWQGLRRRARVMR